MSAAKAKGTKHETLIKNALNGFLLGRYGLLARRVVQEGHADTGDLHGVSPFIIQAKAWKDIVSALREGLAGAVVQAQRAKEDYGVAVIKRTGKSIGDAYTVLRFEDFARVLLRLRRAEAMLAEAAPMKYADHMVEVQKDKATAFPKS